MASHNQRKWDINERRSGSIPIGLNNLIICCGVRTEKNYFEQIAKVIKEHYPKQTGINFNVEPDPVDPQKMIKNLESRSDLGLYQHIWVVFDKDDFEKDNFDNAVQKVEALNKKRSEIKYHALWSNECIELWFLLHFEYMNADINREKYFDKLGKYLGCTYEKNNKEIAAKIMLAGGNLGNAIKNAKKLLEMHSGKTPSYCRPATNVVEFFELYSQYIKNFS